MSIMDAHGNVIDALKDAWAKRKPLGE
jgi:hypothetical protein